VWQCYDRRFVTLAVSKAKILEEDRSVPVTFSSDELLIRLDTCCMIILGAWREGKEIRHWP